MTVESGGVTQREKVWERRKNRRYFAPQCLDVTLYAMRVITGSG
jgi:hypothetical protein